MPLRELLDMAMRELLEMPDADPVVDDEKDAKVPPAIPQDKVLLLLLLLGFHRFSQVSCNPFDHFLNTSCNPFDHFRYSCNPFDHFLSTL